MPAILKLIVRYAAILALAAASIAALAAPAAAFPLDQFVSASELAAHCHDAGGTPGGTDNYYWCKAPNGNSVECGKTEQKCFGHVALTSSGAPKGVVSIPCDPFLCKIFCGGRPNCTFGGEPVAIRPVKQDFLPPPSLVTSVPGGGSPAPVKTAGVPTKP
jgi:hypothetical protein